MAQPIRSDAELRRLLSEARRTGNAALLEALSDDELARLEALEPVPPPPGPPGPPALTGRGRGAGPGPVVGTTPAAGPGAPQAPAVVPAEAGQPWRLAEALPTIGATIGSLATGGLRIGPGMAGAALGGAVGEALRQAVEALGGRWEAVPPTLRDQLQAIAKEAAIQSGLELGGRALLGATGRALVQQASGVRPSDVEAFGDVARVLVRERIPVGPGLADRSPARPYGVFVRGSAKAEVLRNDLARQVRALLAPIRTVSISGRPAIEHVDEVITSVLRGTPGTYEREAARLSQLRRGLIDELTGGLTPLRAHELKQYYQELAAPLYSRLHRGERLTARDRADLRFYQAAARGLRGELARRVPGYAELESRLSELIGATRVVRRAEAARLASHGEFGLARSAPVKAAIQVLADPAVWSRAGLGLTSPLTWQAPRLLREWMEQAR